MERADATRRLAESKQTVFGPTTALAEWSAHWIEKIKPKWDEAGRRTGIKHSSWRGYEKHVRLNIVPLAIGKTPLDRLTTPMIMDWLEHLASDERTMGPLGPRSIKYALDTIRRALAGAKLKGLVKENVATGISPPSQTVAETQIFTLEEARRFMQAIRGHPDEALLLVSVFAGPRQGETLSLRRTDVNLTKGYVTFRHTLDWIDGRPAAEENKNATARSVHLPPYVIDVLRAHLESQQARFERAAEPGLNDAGELLDYGLVFAGELGQPLRGSTVYRRFHRLLTKAELPLIRWHDLRHSAASIMLALGLSLHTVQKTIGHASLHMLSQRYGHIVPELAADELARMESALVGL